MRLRVSSRPRRATPPLGARPPYRAAFSPSPLSPLGPRMARWDSPEPSIVKAPGPEATGSGGSSGAGVIGSPRPCRSRGASPAAPLTPHPGAAYIGDGRGPRVPPAIARGTEPERTDHVPLARPAPDGNPGLRPGVRG